MDSFLADDGERLHYRVTGNGSPLVLLHGWTASHAIWNPVLELLQRHQRVYCPDARGHGGHALLSSQVPDVMRLASDIQNLLDHHNIERAAFAGHSMGALTLWQYIRDFGCDRITQLCIVDQSPKLVTDEFWSLGIYGDFDAERSQRLIEDLGIDFVETVLRLIANGLNTKARETYARNSRGWQQTRHGLENLKPDPLIAIWKSLVEADYRDVLPMVSVPTLLTWGEQSNFYSVETARYLLGQIPHATLSSYAGADHCPQLAQPERFAQELASFVANEK
jgi:pimeloyl-ACP methyl ester carboxylesterase